MIKIANQVIDAHDDSNKEILCKIASKNPNIIMMSDDERSKLHEHEFALCLITKTAHLNKFPINDRDSTFLSNEFFDYTHHRLTKEAAEIAAVNIKTACDRFKVKPVFSVFSLAKQAEARVKSNICTNTEKVAAKKDFLENPLAKYAEVSKICDNDVNATYAFGTSEDCQNGNRYFENFADKIPAEYRFKYASALQKRASEIGVKLTGKIEKYAGNGYNAHVDHHIKMRKDLLKKANLVLTLEKISSMRNDVEPIEFAKLLADFDKVAGLSQYHNGYLADPYKATFSMLPNDKMVNIKTASGTKGMSASDLSKLAMAKFDKISTYLGKNVAEAMKKDGIAVFESLPMDAKELIGHIADGSL